MQENSEQESWTATYVMVSMWTDGFLYTQQTDTNVWVHCIFIHPFLNGQLTRSRSPVANEHIEQTHLGFSKSIFHQKVPGILSEMADSRVGISLKYITVLTCKENAQSMTGGHFKRTQESVLKGPPLAQSETNLSININNDSKEI